MQVAATEDKNVDQTDLIYGPIVMIQPSDNIYYIYVCVSVCILRVLRFSILNQNQPKLSHNLELWIKKIVDAATPPCHVRSACQAEKNTHVLRVNL